MDDNQKALAHAAAALQAIYQWVDRVNDAGGCGTISGIATANSMIASLNKNRARFQSLIVDPINAALAGDRP